MNVLFKILLGSFGIASARVLSDKFKKQEQSKPQKTDAIPKKQENPQEKIPLKKEMLPKELVYTPDITEFQSMKIPELHITAQQAVQQGFSFRKKSKSIRITNYHGTSENLLIPTLIDNLKVNEIGQKAFYQNQTVKKIQIPSSIKKLGKYSFRESQLQTCIFADGLQSIPEACFFGCQELSEIHLPKTLQHIGDSAMASCKKLNYIQFPPNLYKLGNHVFSYSGLNGFGYSNRYLLIRNGLAFRFTPLQNKYALILSRKYPYDTNRIYVLLIGDKAKDFSFLKNKSISLLKNSILGSYPNRYHSLDLHKCRAVSMEKDSFCTRYDKNGVPENHIHIILPQDIFSYRLPAGVSGYNGTTEQPIEKFHYQKINDNLITVRNTMTTGGMYTETYVGEICCSGYKTLKIEKVFHHRIYENAIRIFDIQEIELGEFLATGAIFSGLCTALHKISWLEQQEIITKYIPSAELVGEFIHKDLLKAFAPVDNSFFDSKRIADIFLHHPVIHTRHRVFIAIDMLRSTQRACDSDTEIYHIYLKNHIRQAEKFCQNVQNNYPEYSEFLEQFKLSL